MIQEPEQELEQETPDQPTELVIDDSNFHEYFFDVRLHQPKRGQVMAAYTSMAKLVKGKEKENLVDLLMQTTKVRGGVQVMRKLFHACEEDAIRVPKRIVEDLISGMSREEVLDKDYDFKAELYFYTKSEYVPVDDPHWTVVSIANLDDYLSKKEGGYVITTKKTIPDENTVEKLEAMQQSMAANDFPQKVE